MRSIEQVLTLDHLVELHHEVIGRVEEVELHAARLGTSCGCKQCSRLRDELQQIKDYAEVLVRRVN